MAFVALNDLFVYLKGRVTGGEKKGEADEREEMSSILCPLVEFPDTCSKAQAGSHKLHQVYRNLDEKDSST